MTENQMILVGWKEISEACGIRSIKTIKKKAKKYKMPYVRMDGRPSIAKAVLLEWHSALSRMVSRMD